MKRAHLFVAAAAMGSLIAGPAVAQNQEHVSTEPFSMHSWERGHMLDFMRETGLEAEAQQPVIKQPWERGKLLESLQPSSAVRSDVDAPTVAPRVQIYFDSTASEPGLPRSLGNTHAGRSIMLKYLQQAAENEPAS